uniref:Uncharacterized protein n=1 Tax=Anopheles atroparvus TaxID=41427 RepID=A0A182IQI8_ANOAO
MHLFGASRIGSVCCILVVVWCVIAVHAVTADSPWANITDAIGAHHNRDRRYVLSFPVNGGVAKVLFGFVAPVRFHHKLRRSLNAGINLQANYRILPDIIFPHPESVWKNRYSADAYVDTGRKQLYDLLVQFLASAGGSRRQARICLLRTVCEVADTPLSHNGMVGEIMDIVFAPADTDDLPDEFKMARKYGANGVDCGRVYDECSWGHGLLDTITAMHCHGFDGRACILRTFCEISKVMTPKSGILFKLFKMIFRLPQGDEDYFPYLTANDCEELERHCPVSQLDMDRLDDTAPDEPDEASRSQLN